MDLKVVQKSLKKHKPSLMGKRNVVCVSSGYKIVGGVKTNIPSYVISVRNKLNLSILDVKDVIPPEIDGIKTDVIEIGSIHALGTCVETPGPACSPHGNLYDPLIGGISIGVRKYDRTHTVYYTASGTLGSICVDITDGALVALTNNHVAGITHKNGYEMMTANISGYDFDSYTEASVLTDAFLAQPSYVDNGNVWNQMFTVKKIDGFRTNNSVSDPQLIDVAVLRIDSINKTDCKVLELTDDLSNLVDNGPFPWALPSEVTVGLKVFKSGRTTGMVNFGEITSIDSSPLVEVYSGYDVVYDEQIQTSHSTLCAYSGDSGSGVYARIGGYIKLIGLLHAGNTPLGTVYYTCPIWKIADILNLKAWNGDIILPASYGSSIIKNGKTYNKLSNTLIEPTHLITNDSSSSSSESASSESFSLSSESASSESASSESASSESASSESFSLSSESLSSESLSSESLSSESPGPSYPLDAIEIQPELAYSLRKLRSAYDGDAIQIRTAIGLTDIGFTSGGNLNIDDINTAIAASGEDWATVAIWYDQSGNENDAATAGVGSEPFIVQDSELCRLPNGQPGILFDRDELAPGGTARIVALSGEVIAASLTAFLVGTCEDFFNTYVGGLCATKLDEGVDWNTTGACLFMQGIVSSSDLGGYWAGAQVWGIDSSNNQHIVICQTSGSSLTYTIDGVTSTGLTISGDYTTLPLVRWYIGDRSGTGGQWQGRFGEILIYKDTLDTEDLTVLSNNIYNYWPLAETESQSTSLTSDSLTSDSLTSDSLTSDSLTSDSLTSTSLTSTSLTSTSLTSDSLLSDDSSLTSDSSSSDQPATFASLSAAAYCDDGVWSSAIFGASCIDYEFSTEWEVDEANLCAYQRVASVPTVCDVGHTFTAQEIDQFTAPDPPNVAPPLCCVCSSCEETMNDPFLMTQISTEYPAMSFTFDVSLDGVCEDDVPYSTISNFYGTADLSNYPFPTVCGWRQGITYQTCQDDGTPLINAYMDMDGTTLIVEGQGDFRLSGGNPEGGELWIFLSTAKPDTPVIAIRIVVSISYGFYEIQGYAC